VFFCFKLTLTQILSCPYNSSVAKYYVVKRLEYVTLLYVPQTLIKRFDGIYISKIFEITNVYIKGEDNEVSDLLSTLCAVSDSNEYLTMLEEYRVAPAP